jgi:hypothetical protein
MCLLGKYILYFVVCPFSGHKTHTESPSYVIKGKDICKRQFFIQFYSVSHC